MKAQYLSLDSIIAAIIFIMLTISLFTFLRFTLFSNQFYERDSDQTAAYASYLLLSRDTTYSIVDTSREGKIIYSDYVELSNRIDLLADSIPYYLYVAMDCEGTFMEFNPPLTANIRFTSHVRRIAENTDGKICNIDVYLGVEK